MSNTPDHAHQRGSRLILAVSTSLVSKMGSFLLQLIAIPIAMKTLGFEIYGVYAVLVAFIYFLTITGVGLGPGLTRAITKAQAMGDKESEKRYFQTAIVMLICAGSVGAGIIYFCLHNLPATTLFGKEFAPYQSIIYDSAPFVAIMLFMEILLSIVDRMQAGYQAIHRVNLWGSAGNFIGAGLLIACIHRWPEIPFLMFCVIGMQQLGKLGNGIVMLLGERRYLLSGPKRVSWPLVKELAKDGVAFTAAQCLSPLMRHEGGKFLASHLGGPVAAGIYAVLNQMSTMLGGFIAMFTAPLWPALMDAAHRQDFRWFETARKRLWIAVLVYSFGVGIFLSTLGSGAIELWLHGEVHISPAILLAFSCFYICMAWNHVTYICLTALGSILKPAVIAVTESAIALVLGWYGMKYAGLEGLLWAMAGTMVMVTVWVFPVMLMNRIRQCKASAETSVETPLTPSAA